MKRTKMVRTPIKRTKVVRRRPMKEEDEFDINIKSFGRHPHETFGDLVFAGRINGVSCSGSYYEGGHLWRISLAGSTSLADSSIFSRVLEAYMIEEYAKETRELIEEMRAEGKQRKRETDLKMGRMVRTPIKKN